MDMLEEYIDKFKEKKEVYLRIKVRPGSVKNEVKEIMEDETIKINISAVPEKGKANEELISFLSKVFTVNKNNIKIISGKVDKIKLVKIVSL